ncbi:MAG: hypothetical protein ACK6D3_04715 [Planctomycetaceae bacterium]|jgi:hypothetical protein
MKTFVLNEKEISMTTEWNELSLGQYINFMKLNERREKEEMVQDFYLLSLMEVLCKVDENELDDLSLAEYQENLEAMKFLLDTPTVEDTDVIEIDGVKYCLPQRFDSLSAGEYISIKTLQSRYENNIEGLPYLVAVILRPLKEEQVDAETGEKVYIQEKFDTKNLQWRADLFNDKLQISKIMTAIGFFFNGNKS